MDDSKQSLRIIFIGLLLFLIEYLVKNYIASHLSPSLFGDFNVGLSCISFAATLLLFGSDLSSTRFLSKYLKTQNTLKAEQFVRWNFKILFTTSFIYLAMVVILLLATPILTYLNRIHIGLAMLWATPFFAISLILGRYLFANNNIILATVIMKSGKYLTLISVFSISVYLIQPMMDETHLSLIAFLSFLLLCSITYAFTLYLLPINLGHALKTPPSPKGHDHRKWSKTSSNFIINGVMHQFNIIADLLIVELFVHSESATGHYSAMLTIAGVLWLAPNFAYQKLKPKLSHLMEHDKTKLFTKLALCNRSTYLASSILLLVIVIFGKQLLALFGPSYAAFYPETCILSAGYISLTIAYGPLIIATFCGREKLTTISSACEAIGLVLITPFMAHFYNILGVAIAGASLLLLKSIYIIYQGNKFAGFNCMSIFPPKAESKR